jgi:alpha-beta hydrolase superfamily lysophospholipase
MKHPVPDPPEIGMRDGLSYALFLPDGDPPAGVVIAHGAGSAKESHFDFARMLRSAGLGALAFDARGHGRSEGVFGPDAFDDVVAMCTLMREHAPRVAVRGSSMGGFSAIQAAAAEGAGVAAVVAICPATEDILLWGLRSGRIDGFEAAPLSVLELWLESLDTTAAAASLGPETALLLLHAQGDEQVPFTISQELHEAAADPKRLLLVPGGHHRSLQHDMEMQAASLRFIQDAVGVRTVARRGARRD